MFWRFAPLTAAGELRFAFAFPSESRKLKLHFLLLVVSMQTYICEESIESAKLILMHHVIFIITLWPIHTLRRPSSIDGWTRVWDSLDVHGNFFVAVKRLVQSACVCLEQKTTAYRRIWVKHWYCSSFTQGVRFFFAYRHQRTLTGWLNMVW